MHEPRRETARALWRYRALNSGGGPGYAAGFVGLMWFVERQGSRRSVGECGVACLTSGLSRLVAENLPESDRRHVFADYCHLVSIGQTLLCTELSCLAM